ncbi:MAG: PBP1A family penicillin-binding protein [Chitinivibrionales bacterium]|nr:PBP1A family penicillin-binding protein [Chitinivibrionales bacterium]
MQKFQNPRKFFGPREPASPPPESDNKVRGKLFFIIVIAFLVSVVSLGTGGMWFLYRMYQTLPTLEQMENIEPSLVSKVLARDSSVIHEFSIERRFWMPLEKIPQNLQDAVVAIEDRRFYSHWGIDIKRIVSAVMVDVLRRKFAQGASTITQQLARNLYLTSRRSLIRKVREAITAVQIENYYTKPEILELYLNQVYLGAGVYGVEAAAQQYFSKTVSDLTLNECAVLAGTIQLPEYYRPDKEKNLKRITIRRNSVLRAMRKMGFIEKDAAVATIEDTIPSDPQKRSSKVAPYFVEMVRKRVIREYGEDLLYNGGLTIHTTLDPMGQDSLEVSAKRHLATLQKRLNRMFLDSSRAYKKLGISYRDFLDNFDSLYAAHKEEFKDLPDSAKLRLAQTAVIALDVETGAILALKGGRSFNETKFNRVTQSLRQPGSAFKPFVYTAALSNGYTAASVVLDQPITLETSEGDWRPENYDKEFLGPITVREALRKSVNLVAIQVFNDIGPQTVIECARRMGLKHNMQPVPSLAIGSCEVTPIEITAAYAVYPHLGKWVKPFCIEKIVDKNGKVLQEHVAEAHQIISPQLAFVMSDLLREVVQRGTGASIPRRGFNRTAGGKTGTTNDYSDAWFVGFTPQIACGVWVGVDERRTMGYVTGAKGAIPIWVPTMMGLHESLPAKGFSRPPGVVTAKICNKSHKRAGRYCSDISTEYFIAGNLPEQCDIHVLRKPGQRRPGQDMFGTPRRRSTEKKKRPLMF